MPRYRVNQLSYIGDQLVQEGGEIEYDGVPGDNLDPLDKAAEKAKKGAADAKAKAMSSKRTTIIEEGRIGERVEPAEATVVRKGDDLESPFTPANPPPGDGESRLGEHGEDHPNPTAVRPADSQPEVGPTETQVDPKAVDKLREQHDKAAEKGQKSGPKNAGGADLA